MPNPSPLVAGGLSLLLTFAAHADPDTYPFAEDARIETLTDGYRFTEGPALAPDGSIYFSDIPNNAIHRYDPATGKTTLFTDDSGGANGLMFDTQGLVACAGGARRVIRFAAPEGPPDTEPTGMVLVERYDGLRLNSPNDLAVTHLGVIYFTDPRYGSRDDLEQPTEAVYVAIPTPGVGLEKGVAYTLTRLIDDLVRPNGIGVSPDEKTLYVNDNAAKKVMAYNLVAPGEVAHRRVLHDLGELGGPDGMGVDSHGRLYVAVYDRGIVVLSPEGERLGFLPTGPQTTNCALGADETYLYITADKGLKRVALDTAGTPPPDVP